MRKGRLMLVALAALTLVAGACSSDKTPTTTDDAGTTITVDLKEFSITPAATTAAAGKVTFAATNSGTMNHELVVLKTDLAPDKLPVADNKANEDADGVTSMGEIEEFGVGKTETKTFDMTAGTYVLICNIVSHYARGMRTAFTVS